MAEKKKTGARREKVRKSMITLLTVGVLYLLSSPAPNALGKEPEEIWKDLSKVSMEERESHLLLGAKSEGTVVLYANIEMPMLQSLKSDFEKRFPGIKMDLWRGAGVKTPNRVSTEARAGRFAVDVISLGNEHVPLMLQFRLVGRYVSPERRFLPDDSKDREGYWTSYRRALPVIAYNTRLVSAKEAPRNYEEFLTQKWKGDFAIDMEPHMATMGWLKLWGFEKTEKFMASLVKNDVVVRKGHDLLTELLCAGEFKGAIELYAHRVAYAKHVEGCPVEMIYPDPTPGALTHLLIAKRAPHPHAAALLFDYIFSEAGQKILADQGALVNRKGIRPKYPELDIEGKGVRVLVATPEDAVRLGKMYQQLQKKFLLRR